MRNTVTFVFLLLFLLPLRGRGQVQSDSADALPRPYIEGNIGFALAPRTLFNSSSTTDWMDYVKPGYCAGLNGGLPLFHSHFGIRGTWCYYRNGFNMNKYSNLQQSSIASSAVTSVDYGDFTQYSFMLGGFASYSLHKLSIEFFALAGGEDLILPNTEVDIKITSPGQAEYTSTVVYTTKLQFGYGGGAEAVYNINKKLAISLSLDCLASKVPFKDVIYDDYIQHINYQYNYTGTATVFITSLKAGLRYSFGK